MARRLILCRGVRLVIEPDVLHAPAVVDAVDHYGQVFHLRVPADAAASEKDERFGIILDQPLFDLPHELPALVLVRLD